ncbi:MAG: hypothetical protein JWO89_2748 [Verrucomicrobiaceae bacterium]|nr:hypothetical protein [Verrucomicrobiaceae bacterium]
MDSSREIDAVLVVEDNDMYRGVVVAVLNQCLQGCEMLEAANVKNALIILRSRPVDVMVVDMNLPDGTALTLLDQVQDMVRSRLKTIVFSNHASEDMMPLESRQDVHCYVEKAQGPMHLAKAIQDLRKNPTSNVSEVTVKNDRFMI